MTHPYPHEQVAEPFRFAYVGVPADPVAAATVREGFGHWLRRHFEIAETRLCDVILAVNEALANAVEFAYTGCPGTFDLEAFYDHMRSVLTVTVSDQGRWRDRDPLQNDRCRGRGITLMRSLADAVIIETSGLGTHVCLRFDNVSNSLASVC